ncbi:hypothetical protein KFK09_026653 [Dendrobium nobile]|uniref:Uncharacterized protein n=1 Tax=Dendrobium nobile TaxID=94219 RepID=A0A8T3A9B2_DENNO|nr:hypothetical protein KFK09_026653 [Dendrobium nobile]
MGARCSPWIPVKVSVKSLMRYWELISTYGALTDGCRNWSPTNIILLKTLYDSFHIQIWSLWRKSHVIGFPSPTPTLPLLVSHNLSSEYSVYNCLSSNQPL